VKLTVVRHYFNFDGNVFFVYYVIAGFSLRNWGIRN